MWKCVVSAQDRAGVGAVWPRVGDLHFGFTVVTNDYPGAMAPYMTLWLVQCIGMVWDCLAVLLHSFCITSLPPSISITFSFPTHSCSHLKTSCWSPLVPDQSHR
jgi:hypothetical protein